MKPIICKNETRDVLEKLQEYADNDGIIKSLYLVDQTQEQTVILVAEEPITKEVAEIWWSGYIAALGDQS